MLDQTSYQAWVLVANSGKDASGAQVSVQDLTNGVMLGQTNVYLAAGSSRWLSFFWSAQGFAPGSHEFELRVSASGDAVASNDLVRKTYLINAPLYDLQVSGASCQSVVAPGSTNWAWVRVENVGSRAAAWCRVKLSASSGTVTPAEKWVWAWSGWGGWAGFQWQAGTLEGETILTAEVDPVGGETSLANNRATKRVAVTTASDPYDLAAEWHSAPNWVVQGQTIWISAGVLNRGIHSQTCTVLLEDLTEGKTLGSASLLIKAGSYGVVSLPWSTSGALIGHHELECRAVGAPNEFILANNSRRFAVQVVAPLAEVSVCGISRPGTVVEGASVKIAPIVLCQSSISENITVVLRDRTNGTELGTKVVAVAPNASVSVPFQYTVTGPPGLHEIVASVSVNHAEINPNNNTMVGSFMCMPATVDATAPSVPVPKAPENDSSVSFPLTLDWFASTDPLPGSSVQNYDVEVGIGSDFAALAFSASPGSPGANVSSLPSGQCSWRVRARDRVGNVSAWSSVGTFAVPTPPGPPPDSGGQTGGGAVVGGGAEGGGGGGGGGCFVRSAFAAGAIGRGWSDSSGSGRHAWDRPVAAVLLVCAVLVLLSTCRVGRRERRQVREGR